MTSSIQQLIAQDLLATYGTNLSHVTVVFPGKRARLFLNQQLVRQANTPIWAPKYQSIDDLFMALSPYKKAEKLETICTLHKHFCQLVSNAPSLDEFYSWAEVILNDFEDIDKHLADAHRIFRNVYELAELTDTELDSDDEKVIQQFFANFTQDRRTDLKDRFLEIWNIMPQLYDRLNEEQRQHGKLYTGALYRDVIENRLPSMPEPTNPVCFCGFNVLDDVEETLFTHYQQAGVARFYWDYDNLYASPKPTTEQRTYEAGEFLCRNLVKFPCALPHEAYDNLRHHKDITFIASNTDTAQSHYIPQWLNEQLTQPESETAIVLCNEQLLQSVLHAIPDTTPFDVNVTMGYPLIDTPVFPLVMSLLDLQIEGYDLQRQELRYIYQRNVRRQPLIAHLPEDEWNQVVERDPQTGLVSQPALLDYVCRLLRQMAVSIHQQDTHSINDTLYVEALWQVSKRLLHFNELIHNGTLQVQHPSTLRRLARADLQTISIPFHGEPASGLQIMGVLETRTIDFRHLLMLGVGEGYLPKKVDDTTFIPHALREAYKLTTIRHRISVFAYYFYRLIQRTEHVTLVYNENTAGVQANEISRFMRQLQALTNLPIRNLSITSLDRPKSNPTNLNAVVKTPQIMDDIRNYLFGRRVAPTAINTYLECPYHFYLQNICGLYNKEEEEEFNNRLLGNIFHKAMEHFYHSLMKHYDTAKVTSEMLRSYIEEKGHTQLQRIVDQAIRSEYLDKAKAASEQGITLIVRDVLLRYMLRQLKYDLEQTPFTIKALEKNYETKLQLPEGEVRIGGIVDRLQEKAGRLYLIDYKTAKEPPAPIPSVSAAFGEADDKGNKHTSSYYLQQLVYATALADSYPHMTITPQLHYPSQMIKPDYDPTLTFSGEPILDASQYANEVKEQLTQILHDILNPDITFAQNNPADKKTHCSTCAFAGLCR